MRNVVLALILLSTAFLRGDVTATLSPNGVAVTWSSNVVVCPWLEDGAFILYAGGSECRKSGSNLLTYIPNDGAYIRLRTPDGIIVAETPIINGYRVILPYIQRETQ